MKPGILDISRKFKNDLYVIGVMVLIGIIGLIAYRFFDAGEYAVVYVSGEKKAVYPLCEDISVEIEGYRGSNLLIIEDKKAYLKEATCPDKLCVGMGAISKSGQTIICLPNRVSIEITGKAPQYDSIAGAPADNLNDD